jgi:hypothetical protein
MWRDSQPHSASTWKQKGPQTLTQPFFHWFPRHINLRHGCQLINIISGLGWGKYVMARYNHYLVPVCNIYPQNERYHQIPKRDVADRAWRDESSLVLPRPGSKRPSDPSNQHRETAYWPEDTDNQ